MVLLQGSAEKVGSTHCPCSKGVSGLPGVVLGPGTLEKGGYCYSRPGGKGRV